ncbi:MAG: UbiA family prenyltransferase [Euryarchaeota archaeon]|nr:UbiA family prenyltransferase [Euryarchaeota archaeon]
MISANGLAKLYFSFLLFGLTAKTNLLFATFLVTYSTYSLNKLTDKEEDAVNNPARSRYVTGNERFLTFLAIISYIVAILLGYFENIFAALVLLVPLVTGIVYSTNIFSVFGVPRLKDVFVVKSLLVTLSWTIVIAFLPAICSGEDCIKLLSIAFFFFIKSFVNTVLFDVMDVEGDRKNFIKTIPVKIGISGTRWLLLSLQSLLAVWLLTVFGLFDGCQIILIISIIYGYLYILHFCNSDNHTRSSMDILVDGEWIIMVALYTGINSCFGVLA